MQEIVIRVTDPGALKSQIAEAHRLRKEGKRVVIVAEDLDTICKYHDPDTIAEWLDGIRFEDSEAYSWSQIAMKARQRWIDEEKADQSTGNQAN